jgi:hypothetical protein
MGHQEGFPENTSTLAQSAISAIQIHYGEAIAIAVDPSMPPRNGLAI